MSETEGGVPTIDLQTNGKRRATAQGNFLRFALAKAA